MQATDSDYSISESLLIVAHASYLIGDFKLCKFFLQRMGKLGYENEEILLLEGNPHGCPETICSSSFFLHESTGIRTKLVRDSEQPCECQVISMRLEDKTRGS